MQRERRGEGWLHQHNKSLALRRRLVHPNCATPITKEGKRVCGERERISTRRRVAACRCVWRHVRRPEIAALALRGGQEKRISGPKSVTALVAAQSSHRPPSIQFFQSRIASPKMVYDNDFYTSRRTVRPALATYTHTVRLIRQRETWEVHIIDKIYSHPDRLDWKTLNALKHWTHIYYNRFCVQKYIIIYTKYN